MLKIISAAFCLGFFLVFSADAQRVKPEPLSNAQKWEHIADALTKEDWSVAYKLTDEFLTQVKVEDAGHYLARVRFAYLFAAGGAILNRVIVRETVAARLKELAGKEIELPPYEIVADCRTGGMNNICPKDGAENSVMVTATNNGGFRIHAFIYVQLKEKFDLARHEETAATIHGTIGSIELSPPTASIWAFRVLIYDGTIELDEPPAPST
jgi:hypothetical protein